MEFARNQINADVTRVGCLKKTVLNAKLNVIYLVWMDTAWNQTNVNVTLAIEWIRMISSSEEKFESLCKRNQNTNIPIPVFHMLCTTDVTLIVTNLALTVFALAPIFVFAISATLKIVR